jgi:lipooligosaccharide transport system permease protein
VQAYPQGLRWVVELSPLYHGVAIERSLLLGTVSPSLLWHVLALVAMGAVGLAVTGRRLSALLLK